MEDKKSKFSILSAKGSRSAVETTAQIIFTICSVVAVVAVFSITLYMIISGTPAIFKVGLLDILFGSVWAPTAATPSYGILYIILTSIVGTALAILIGVPIGILTAVFLAEAAPKKLAAVVKPAVELLAGIPSVIYGLVGILVLNPVMYKLELFLFQNSKTHQFTGGANLISAVIVLAIMILPTVINISESALKAVPQNLKSASLALGASHIQTIFKVMIPAAKIEEAVAAVAAKINEDYREKRNPLFLGVLNGSFMFMSDLLKKIDFNCEISFVKLSSYCGTSSSGCLLYTSPSPRD